MHTGIQPTSRHPRHSGARGWPAPLLLAAVLCAAAGTAAASPGGNGTSGHYVDPTGYLQTDAGYEAWFHLRLQLRRNFDDICGDTFCEGEYSNIESLRFQCSVHRVTGRVGDCSWSFAASDESVEPLRGRVRSTPMAWACRVPGVRGWAFDTLLGALAGDQPLYAPLPGQQRTLYDVIGDCL